MGRVHSVCWGRILLSEEHTRARKVPLFSSTSMVSTVEGGAEIRRRTRLPECRSDAGVYGRQAGDGVTASKRRGRVGAGYIAEFPA